MTTPRGTFFGASSVAFLLAALTACGSTTPAGSGALTDVTAQPPHTGLAPRMDLHCTPSGPDEEALCIAQGEGHHLGPMRFDNGPARASQEALDREEAAYGAKVASGTLPCECLSGGTMVPFQSPPH